MGREGTGETRDMTDQEQEDWWNRPGEPKKPKPSADELMDQINKMRLAQEGIPKGLVFMQFIALVFITINAIFMYSNVSHPMAIAIAVYMVPSTMLFIHYLMIIRQLKQIAKGKIEK